MPPEVCEQLRIRFGWDHTLSVQYAKYVGALLQGVRALAAARRSRRAWLRLAADTPLRPTSWSTAGLA